MIWFTTHSLACRSQILFPRGQPKSRTNAPLSATADLDDYDLEEVALYPISEKRGIDEEGVRVRLPTMIEAAGVNGKRRLRYRASAQLCRHRSSTG